MSEVRRPNKLEPLVIGAAYLLLSLVATRGLLPQPGTLGHAVDWYIAPDPAYLARGYSSYLSMWSEPYLGSSGTIYAYNYPLHMLLMVPGAFGVSGNAISKLFVLFTLLVAAWSAYYLARYVASSIASDPEEPGDRESLLTAYLPSFLAGCLYAFGPTAFGVILSGAPQILFGYAMAPMAFLLLLRAMRNPTPRRVILASIAGAIMVASIQMALLLYATVPLMVVTSPCKRRSLIALVLLIFLMFLLMLYWMLPVASTFRHTVTQPLATEEVDLDQTLTWLDTRTDPLSRVLTTEWYLKRAGTIFSAAEDVPSSLLPLWVIGVFSVVVLVFSVPLICRNNLVLLWMSLVCLMLIGLSAGGKSPMREVVFGTYKHAPSVLAGLFRYPIYWMFPVPLFYAALFGGVGKWGDLLSSNVRIIASMMLVMATVLWMAPFWDGVLYNRLDVFRYPPELSRIDHHFLTDPAFGRALYLPTENAVLFEQTGYQQGDGFGGKDTILALGPRSALSVSRVRDHGSAEVTFLLQEALMTYPPPQSISMLLGMTNVRYIVLRRDVSPVTPRIAPYWEWPKTQRVLSETQDQGIELIEDYAHMSLWRNDRAWSHVYIASDLVKAPAGSTLACLPDIAAALKGQTNIAVVEDDLTAGSYQYSVKQVPNGDSDNECVILEQSGRVAYAEHLPEVEFQRLNGGRYELQVREAAAPFLLVISETFHPQWDLSIKDPHGQAHSLSLGSKSRQVHHVRVNGFANGWWIEEPGTYDVTVEFTPDRWYRVGGIVSGVTLLLCMIYLTLSRQNPLIKRYLTRYR